jgi:hypothetical protein
MIKIKNLFEETQEATQAQPTPQTQPTGDVGFKSPYTVSNQEALAKELSNINKDTELLSNKIVDSYKKNEFSLKIGMAAESNFDRFVVLLQNTFSLNDILKDAPEVQKRLAELVSLAYFYAQKDPDKRFRVYSDKDTAVQVTNAIFSNLISSLKMTFLTYDTEFSGLLKKAIQAVIFYDKPKK